MRKADLRKLVFYAQDTEQFSEINGDFANTRGHFAQSDGPRNEATA